jgi:hypothetical protein
MKRIKLRPRYDFNTRKAIMYDGEEELAISLSKGGMGGEKE